MTKKVVNLESQSIAFTFDDGSVQTCELGKVPAALHVRIMLHGLSQKIGDSYANAAKAENPLTFAKESAAETIAQIYAGEWNAARTGGGGKRVSLFAQALARITGKSVDEADAFEESLDETQLKAWKAKEKVRQMMAIITAERAAARARKLAETIGEDISF